MKMTLFCESTHDAVQSQNTVSAYFTKQIMYLCFAEQNV